MIEKEFLASDYDDDPDCGIDAASDRGYWLEDAYEGTAERLITWRKEAYMSTELLAQKARIPHEEYLLIEEGKRTMTQGEAWRIDAAIIHYRRSKENWFQNSWKRGFLSHIRYYMRRLLNNELFFAIGLAILYFFVLKPYLTGSGYIIGFFLGSALSLGIPACVAVWLVIWIFKEVREE